MTRLLDTMEDWRGTPYRADCRLKGIGVNCINFLAAIMDEMYSVSVPTPVLSFPETASLHSREPGQKAIRELLQAWYGSDKVDRAGPFRCGDVLIHRASTTDHPRAGAGHVAIYCNPWVYHALPGLGVTRTWIKHLRHDIIKAYRPRRQDLWSNI